MRTLIVILALTVLSACSDDACISPVAVSVQAPTPSIVGEAPVYESAHVNCPPGALMWTTFTDPHNLYINGIPNGIIHCEWHCVNYACTHNQDVRVDVDPVSGDVLATTYSDSAYCD